MSHYHWPHLQTYVYAIFHVCHYRNIYSFGSFSFMHLRVLIKTAQSVLSKQCSQESLIRHFSHVTLRKQKGIIKGSEHSCRHGIETHNPYPFNLNRFVHHEANFLISCQINLKHLPQLNYHTMQNPTQQQHAQRLLLKWGQTKL